MRIDGRWLLCDDGVIRPVIRGEVLSVGQSWEWIELLVDTGADRTVLTAADLAKLGPHPVAAEEASISGLGGKAMSVIVETQIRLTHDGPGKVIFRGQFAAVTDLEALDISVLGSDVTGLFAVIADRPGRVVSLLALRHRYSIVQD
jgi:hypothetical protein